MIRGFATIACTMLSAVCVWGADDVFQATYYVDGAQEKEQYRSHTSLEAVGQGTSVVYATNGVDLILTKMRLNKTSGTVNDDNRRDNGHNSVVLADKASKLLVEYCDINSHIAQADGLTAIGEGTSVKAIEGSFVTSRAECAALNAVNGAVIELQKPKVDTYSNQSTIFHTGLNGIITVTEALGESSGQGSPLFYSMGTINASKCRMTSAKWTIGCVDGGVLELTDNELTASGVAGFLIHGNLSDGNHGELSLTANKLTVNEGPLLFVTNSVARISLTDNKIVSKSNDLMWIKADDWGEKGKNGGHVEMLVNKQVMNGDITVDSISSLTMEMLKGARLNGRINSVKNCDAQVRVVLGAGSQWTSKGDSYITSIEFSQPLSKGLKQLKGKHTIYYDSKDPKNSHLEGKVFKTGGGLLCPIE